MTGGKVLIIGKTGRNFGAGMSGGMAYVYNEDGNFENKCNMELIILEELNNEDKEDLKQMLQNHYKYTNSQKAKNMLDNFDIEINKFIKVIPKAYKEVIEQIKLAKEEGLSDDDAMMKAFQSAIK